MTDELKPITQLIDDMRDNHIIEAAILAHVQAAIDAALEILKTSCSKCEYEECDGSLVDHCQECQRKIVTALYAARGTNPLAEAQTRVDALEKQRASLFKEGAEAAVIAAERIAELEHDIEAYRGELGYAIRDSHDGKLSNGDNPKNPIADNLQRRLAEARTDAERYRWLRNEDNWGDDSDNRWACLGELSHGDFDNYIDDAMLAEREKE